MPYLIPIIFAFSIFGYPCETSAHFAAPAKTSTNYRCNEFQGASKTLCIRNQQRTIKCSGLKGIYKRECMEKNEPFRGNGPFRRFSR
ncbi:hypothetical protein A3C37_02690 [Candidatus Peribacteria bacterium RIFCSPHIGHO2_02_FULL_53_20]|nr:MAG: hypothetical protein A3C37_02690 [Candidatus Peribacteria bacterium RIFCSPHIGHO2_02_FULL_53_20]OGJ68106.1 MAG: hypothetical protein A3B61_02380 [Candidatus Peribacteria bacterium RIFCSPLOWO2_01_FULL_53_10]OGJ70055.1 MAG: hypothetical protein A3G69_02830 [Candidatus Peribacteria bacterium RIFCSPLOWO2_12_FULL_53_10]